MGFFYCHSFSIKSMIVPALEFAGKNTKVKIVCRALRPQPGEVRGLEAISERETLVPDMPRDNF